MEVLLGKSLSELQDIALGVGLPRFAGKQLAQWLYAKRVTTFEEMTNISQQGRSCLAERYIIGRTSPVREAVSSDGTRKYLFPIDGGQYIETVYIPEGDRATLCVSTQAGCKMGCRFCMTGTLGFHGQLQASDIINQLFAVDAHIAQARTSGELSAEVSQPVTNIVYMGEGEPCENIDAVLRSLQVLTEPWGCGWSPKRITVSSVGYLPGLKRLIDESDCHVAISLHNPFHEQRMQIMPIERVYPISEVIHLLEQYDWTHQRRISFEYICWHGLNDSVEHEKALLRLLRGLPCRINLIRFHAGVDHSFPASDDRRMVQMRDQLSAKGLTTTIRTSRGEDISAACGMLVATHVTV